MKWIYLMVAAGMIVTAPGAEARRGKARSCAGMIEQSRVQDALDRTYALYSVAHEKCALSREHKTTALKQQCAAVYREAHAAVEQLWAAEGLTMKRTPRDETSPRVGDPIQGAGKWGRYQPRAPRQSAARHEMNELPFAEYEKYPLAASDTGSAASDYERYPSAAGGPALENDASND